MQNLSSLEQHLEIQPDADDSNSSTTTGHHATSSSNPQTRTSPTADDLLQRCTTLLAELEAFKQHLKANKQDTTVEIAHFRNTVKSELRTLERLAAATSSAQNDDDARIAAQEASQHTVNSSNLPFLETVWTTVKNTTGLQALQKRFYWHSSLLDIADSGHATAPAGGIGASDKRKQSALVDVVARNGLEWVKVSLITNTRLLFDKAKQGWEDVSSSEDEYDQDGEPVSGSGNKQDQDGDNDVPLVRMAKDLLKAARTVRIRTNHPQIRIVLPKIELGQIDEIDEIVEQLRRMGCTVECADKAAPSLPLDRVIDTLLINPFATLTDPLNIDCTILLALVSDFSHCAVQAEPWFHRALKRQVEIEDKENLLPNLLYPAIAGRKLLCTHEAAKRMLEIVDTIGTPGERARTKLFVASAVDAAPGFQPSSQTLRQELQQWSKFEVPENLHLPIAVVESVVRPSSSEGEGGEGGEGEEEEEREETDEEAGEKADEEARDDASKETRIPRLQTPPSTHLLLPPAAQIVQKHLTPINQSVFLHGWTLGLSTVTSNRTVVKQIENLLDLHAASDSDWPSIWLCPTARSLVGKEKGRKE